MRKTTLKKYRSHIFSHKTLGLPILEVAISQLSFYIVFYITDKTIKKDRNTNNVGKNNRKIKKVVTKVNCVHITQF